MLRSGLTMGRSNAYALTQRVCAFGAEALADHRHGHVSKMQAPVRQWLEDYCRALARRGHELHSVAGPYGVGGVGKEGRKEEIAPPTCG